MTALLDLFSGAGGAAMGYSRAGFTDIVGVDLVSQPRYPFTFVQDDALAYLRQLIGTGEIERFALIHASPPCQAYTKAAKQWRNEGYEYADMVAATRRLLRASGKPYVIENVPGAPLHNPIMLNGAMFGMRVHRNRLFECSHPLPFTLLPTAPPPVKMGRPVGDGDIVQPVGHFSGVDYARQEMGTPWMTQGDMAQAIPPAYTRYLGEQMLAHIAQEVP